MGALVDGSTVGDKVEWEGRSPRNGDGSGGVAIRSSAKTRGRRRRRLLWSLGAVFVVFVAATLALFVFPPSDLPQHVNGILSFNGDDEPARESLAISLAEKGYSHVLLFSQGASTSVTSCPKVPRVRVVCFVDVTNNTRGEARWAGEYARRHHWHSLLIVPGHAQSMRARVLTQRCFSGHVVVVPASESLLELASDVVHEWGGLLAALTIYRGC
jgi:hypothetical protein